MRNDRPTDIDVQTGQTNSLSLRCNVKDGVSVIEMLPQLFGLPFANVQYSYVPVYIVKDTNVQKLFGLADDLSSFSFLFLFFWNTATN